MASARPPRKAAASSRSPARPAWAPRLERRIRALLPQPGRRAGIPAAKHPEILRQGIRLLAEAAARAKPRLKPHPLALDGQPFDAQLLALSPLYRRSREIYAGAGGTFRATLVSSPRTLSSPILLEQTIEYSPIEGELVWAATDPLQSRSPGHLLHVRTFASSLFHEQSHRILWRMLPPPPESPGGLRRYLNFVESLVVTLDMALGDELGRELAAVFYLSGVIYDPGTDTRGGLTRREYRNFLQAALHATYLNLELFDPGEIPRLVEAMYGGEDPAQRKLARRAALRSGNLDRGFVLDTNPVWQRRHGKAVRRALARLQGEALEIPSDPADNRVQYLFAESWFEALGL